MNEQQSTTIIEPVEYPVSPDKHQEILERIRQRQDEDMCGVFLTLASAKNDGSAN